jgi:hypothetical protein
MLIIMLHLNKKNLIRSTDLRIRNYTAMILIKAVLCLADKTYIPNRLVALIFPD